MGLDINGVRILLDAKKNGACFDNVMTIGRLWLNVYPAKLVPLLEKQNLPAEVFRDPSADTAFSEPFFQSLGAKTVSALDYSDYEGAHIVHDLNTPLRDELKERFDIVYDGGTLEHVFHFPTALRSCMEAVRPGGRLFIHTAMNNLCGHGFYQFSPELFYRAFSAENGFEVERMIAHRVGPYGQWHEVSDPETIRERVEIITFTPMHLLIQARRVKAVPIFAKPPLQSDYSAAWKDANVAGTARAPKRSLLSRTMPGLARLIHVGKTGLEFYRRQSLGNRRFFKLTRKP